MSLISGSRTLHRLVYASRQALDLRASAGALNAAGVDEIIGDIIRASIRNNRAVDVTGLLLVHEGYFLQTLEGPAQAVLTTYGRICNDPRHSDARVLQAGPADRRMFADWNMCARRINPGDDAILDTLSLRKDFDPERLSGRAALRLLWAVRGIQDRTQLQAMV